MSSDTGTSILDEALTYIGQRIASILIQPGEKDKHYIASLHNEVLAAAWVIGLLASSGSAPHIPEPIKVAFHSFSDITNPGTYAAPDGRLLLQAGSRTSVDAKFNLTEWWKLAEGAKMNKVFDVGEELAAGLLRALEMRLASADLRTRTIENFKEMLRLRQGIERCVDRLKSSLEEEITRLDDADRSHET